MSEGVGLVVEVDLKPHFGVVISRPGNVGDDEDRLETHGRPSTAVTVDLLVPLPVQPIQAVVANLDFLVVVEPDCFLHFTTA